MVSSKTNKTPKPLNVVHHNVEWNTHMHPSEAEDQSQPEVVTYFPADCDEKTLSCSQLKFLFIQEQAQHLQEFAVLSSNVTHGHPVNVACQSVQCRDSYSTVRLGLHEKKQLLTAKSSLTGKKGCGYTRPPSVF